jgi:penicillin-binding protein-related factor A (putative recombinase)
MKKVGKQHGYKFEAEIGSSLQRFGHMMGSDANENPHFFYNKLVDTKLFDFFIRCDKCGSRVKHNLIIPKTLGDFYCAMQKGISWFLECKSSEQSSFPIQNIESHQLMFARTLERIGVPYWFIFCDKSREGEKRRAFALSGLWTLQLIVKMEDELRRKSIPWPYIHEQGIELRWLGHGLWSMEDLFGEPETVLKQAGITRKVDDVGSSGTPS